MLKTLDLRGIQDATELVRRLPRPHSTDNDVLVLVREVVEGVRRGGDSAVRGYTLQFDGVDLPVTRVDPPEIKAAKNSIAPELYSSLQRAYDRILAYHSYEPPSLPAFRSDGLEVAELVRPVDRAGIYAPGGRAAYPSTVLMCAAPARVAGVPELVLCVPPKKDGTVPQVVLAAAEIAGIEEVYKIGGAQAIAAMALGTESLGKVDVIVGPGNKYVAEAKRVVSQWVGIPSSFAGPSEVVVVADGTVDLEAVALDVVVQAEHGPDGLAWLITWVDGVADEVSSFVGRTVASSPRGEEIRTTLDTGGYAVVVDGPTEAMAVANAVAPEHLELCVENPESLLSMVQNAGAVFLGAYAPASLGDYAAGPNHVLPTNGSARFASALRPDDFRKHIHVVSADRNGLCNLANVVITIAEAEGLPAHAEAVRLRCMK
ncbi:MAG: histidinol dehydrogenase [Actinobacteria bacterium]|jgi:histidinol dehydrogenase|nr:histidinol dehydrogenase [Actinomycetota bacterium]MCL6095507.1 histidinol dehydrogenase [Actinomycetota bacterium]